MALTIEKREREGILILGLDGRLTMGPEDLALRTALQNSITADRTRIIVDCSRLGNIDTAGVDTLVFFDGKLRQAGGKAVLLALARTHLELPLLAKVDVVFEVFADEQEAVNSFFPDRAIKHFDVLDFVQQQTNTNDSATPDRLIDDNA